MIDIEDITPLICVDLEDVHGSMMYREVVMGSGVSRKRITAGEAPAEVHCGAKLQQPVRTTRNAQCSVKTTKSLASLVEVSKSLQYPVVEEPWAAPEGGGRGRQKTW